MAKFLFHDAGLNSPLGTSLVEAAGLDPTMVRRIVIDLEIGSPGKLYVELLADDSILQVDVGNNSVKITEIDAGGFQ